MIYAMTFFDTEDAEEWDSSCCHGVEANGPFEAVKKRWGHCWLDDPGMDRERVDKWFDGENDSYEFHVIAQDGSQYLVTFDVEPVSFSSEKIPGSRHKPRRRIVWREDNVKIASVTDEHAARYPAKWRLYTANIVAAELVSYPQSDVEEGWWIHHFCEGAPCAECAKLEGEAP
jgi:hypothetical protein